MGVGLRTDNPKWTIIQQLSWIVAVFLNFSLNMSVSGGLGMFNLSNKIMEPSRSMAPSFSITYLYAESSHAPLCSEQEYISYSNLQWFAVILLAHITACLYRCFPSSFLSILLFSRAASPPRGEVRIFS